jgi:hypothetical protein
VTDDPYTDRIDAPEGDGVPGATALAEKPGLERQAVLAYLRRRDFGRVPHPDRRLATGPVWCGEGDVTGFENGKQR